MRLLFALLAVLGLCACDQVYSRKPFVPEAREQGDPELRSGFWIADGYKDDTCPFSPRQLAFRWPDCAAAAMYQRGQWWMVTKDRMILAQTVRLMPNATPGKILDEPFLAQSHWTNEVFKDARFSAPRDADNPFFGWVYAQVTPTKLDAADRIVEARVVRPVCGPPQTATLQDKPVLTRDRFKSFPGLTVVGTACVAPDLETLMRVLKSSDAGATTIHWVRDPS